MKSKVLGVVLFLTLSAMALMSVFVVQSQTVVAKASEQYEASSTVHTVFDVEDHLSLDAAGATINAGAGKETATSYTFERLWRDNSVLRFKLNVSNNVSGVADQRFWFGGATQWNSYALVFNYLNGFMQFGEGSNWRRINCPLVYGVDYYVEISLTVLLGADDGLCCGERIEVKFYDEERSVDVIFEAYDYVGSERCSYARNGGALLPRWGMYAHNNVNFTVKAFDFKRDYVILLDIGGTKIPYDLSYGEEYDFSQYAPEKTGYILHGYKAIVEDAVLVAPLSGKWETDIVKRTNGVYSATFTPYYSLKEYSVSFSFDTDKASLYDAPTTIDVVTAETLTLPELTVFASGYVFLGWYKDAAFTYRTEVYECSDEGLTLYGKVAEGYVITVYYPDGDAETFATEVGYSFSLPNTTSLGYGSITGWEKRVSGGWESASNSFIPAADGEYRAVADKITYDIFYDTDGGTNAAENPADYTVTDDIVLKAPTKEGYIFKGFVNDEGEYVSGIHAGTTGNILLNATYIKDNFNTNETLVLSATPKTIPIYALPETASASFALTKDGTEVAVNDGKAVFDSTGDYVLTYTITLISGETLEKAVTITVVKAKITVSDEYEEQYVENTKLVLIDAVSDDETDVVRITVYKDGQILEYTEFEIVLEQGEYTVEYSVNSGNAEKVVKTFLVTAETQERSGCNASLSGGHILPIVIIVTFAVAGFAILAFVAKNKKNKGERK